MHLCHTGKYRLQFKMESEPKLSVSPLVAGCSIAHKPDLLYVSRRDIKSQSAGLNVSHLITLIHVRVLSSSKFGFTLLFDAVTTADSWNWLVIGRACSSAGPWYRCSPAPSPSPQTLAPNRVMLKDGDVRTFDIFVQQEEAETRYLYSVYMLKMKNCRIAQCWNVIILLM